MTLRADRLALFAAVLVLLAGYLAVYRPAEAALAERYARLDDGRARLDERLALARRAGAARTETGALDEWLRARGLADDRTTIVARFLHDLAGTARADGVDVTGVVAEPGGAPPPVAANAAPTVALDEIPLAVSLRGSYPNLLRVVRALDRDGPAMRVGISALGNADRSGAGSPALRATLLVTLLRIPDPARKAARAAG
jgi:hypothetical protein